MLSKFKYIIVVASLVTTACTKKTFDINTDPNNPTSLPVSKLLPTVEKSLGDALSTSFNGGISEILEVYMHRTSSRDQPNQYGCTGTDFNINVMWTTLYVNLLNNNDVIIKDATAAGNLRYAGIAKILKAYAFSQLVDVFGDVPFSEANKLKAPLLNPKFDDDALIYPQLLTLIDAGIADLNNTTATNALLPGADDVIYQGSVTKWIKAANTIKLKLLTQERLVKNVSADVNTLLTSGNLISTTAESFMLPYGPSSTPDDRNPGFTDYFATQRSSTISHWFYEILKGYNQNIFKNNPDPRIPYYFYNQIKLGQVAPNDANPTEYRDGSFVTIIFGSTGVDNGRTQQNSQTEPGIFPVGGRYDDGKGGGGADGVKLSASSGTGAAPYRFITYADRLFLEAELIKQGVISGDARAKFSAALDESFKQVDYIITNYVKPSSPPSGGIAQNPPALVGAASVNTYKTNVLTEYDANPSKQLQLIMTEKWISSFGSAVDAYTDYRRTGFPIIFDPTNPAHAPGGFVQPPINGDPTRPGAQPKVPVQLLNPFPLSLPWDQAELEANSNAPKQKQPSLYKVFWMP